MATALCASPASTITLFSIGGSDLLLGPCTTCTKFDKKIDIPMAEISGASRNDPRSGL